MAERRVAVKFSAEIQGFKAAMAEAAAATRKTKQATEEAGKAADTHLGRLVKSATNNREAWDQAGSTLTGFGVAALAGVGLAVKSFAEFDKAMSSVQAATHASGAEMAQFRDLAVSAGADTSFSAKEAAQGIEELSKAGVETKDILGGGLAGALSLAAAGELDVAEAAETAASAMTQFGLAGKDIPHIADLLAAGAGKAQGSVQDMGQALNQVGLVAAQTGLTIEETTGGLAAFASAGLIGSDAGTSFKTMLAALTPNSKAAAEKMAELGINAFDAQGKFIGLSEFAGVLETSMRDLSDAERNAAMETIFGSDAVRAAAVLYEQGADDVQKWEDAVNDAGFAATTAALKQNNLAGDIEKLGGSLDAVFLKSGSGANDFLRGLAQNAENVVDAIGSIPGPLLNAGAGITAVAGAAALAGGAFLTLFPRVLEARQSFQALSADSPKVAGALGKIGKAAGILGAALAGLQIGGAIQKSFSEGATSAEDFAQATLNTSDALKGLNGIFAENEIGIEVKGLGDALLRLNDNLLIDNVNNFIGDLAGGTSATQRMRDNMASLDDQLGSLAKGGSGEKAAEMFRLIKDEADRTADAQNRTRLSTEDLLKLTPEYADALKAQATSAGETLTQQELLDFAMGKMPPALQAATTATQTYTDATGAAKPVTEEMAEALEEVGLKADASVANIVKYTDALINAGLLNLSARDAARGFQAALDAVTESVKTNGTTLDINTEKGRANQAALDAVAAAGYRVAQANAAHGGSEKQLKTDLDNTYLGLVAAAKGLGQTGTEAEATARKIMQIPPNVSIDSWMDSEAKRMVEQTGAAADRVDGKVVRIYTEYHETTFQKVIRQLSGDAAPVGAGTVLRPKKATGGRLPAFTDGGRLPTTGPGTEVTDGFLALDSYGVPSAWLDAGEWTINALSSERYNRELAAINAGTFPKLPGFTNGGREFSARDFGYVPAVSAGKSGPAAFEGNLFLDSGEFLGKVRGVARQEAGSVLTAADKQTQYSRTGR